MRGYDEVHAVALTELECVLTEAGVSRKTSRRRDFRVDVY